MGMTARDYRLIASSIIESIEVMSDKTGINIADIKKVENILINVFSKRLLFDNKRFNPDYFKSFVVYGSEKGNKLQ